MQLKENKTTTKLTKQDLQKIVETQDIGNPYRYLGLRKDV